MGLDHTFEGMIFSTFLLFGIGIVFILVSKQRQFKWLGIFFSAGIVFLSIDPLKNKWLKEHEIKILLPVSAHPPQKVPLNEKISIGMISGGANAFGEKAQAKFTTIIKEAYDKPIQGKDRCFIAICGTTTMPRTEFDR